MTIKIKTLNQTGFSIITQTTKIWTTIPIRHYPDILKIKLHKWRNQSGKIRLKICRKGSIFNDRSSKYSPYQTRYPYSIIWESLMCYCRKFKSMNYQEYMKDVGHLDEDSSIESILVSIETLKSQVKLLSEQSGLSNVNQYNI